MRDYALETKQRIAFIKSILQESKASGIIYGNSGGKDAALVGILCKMACANTVGLIMPCESKRNFKSDMDDGKMVAKQYNIETRIIDLTQQKLLAVEKLGEITQLDASAVSNIAPRLRMITLYAVAKSENLIVAGTGNRSEMFMGYFTKWGDGAYDFNPISDLTVSEVYEFLRYLKAPEGIIKKAPSAGLFEGQTDEDDMGVTYAAIDKYLTTGEALPRDKEIIERYHKGSEHKRKMQIKYEGQ